MGNQMRGYGVKSGIPFSSSLGYEERLCLPVTRKFTSGSAIAEGHRDALSVEILQLQNIPFEN